MKSIAIDTNLLVLLVVGLTDRNLIEKHKRTKSFQCADLDLLIRVLSRFDQIIVTPHILTEASNLIVQVGEPAASALRKTLSVLLESQREEFEPSIEVSKHHEFLRLGLTDCAILNVIGSEMPFITTDLDLYLSAAKSNNSAINFNHLRQDKLVSI
jgi:hypothetical protein